MIAPRATVTAGTHTGASARRSATWHIPPARGLEFLVVPAAPTHRHDDQHEQTDTDTGRHRYHPGDRVLTNLVGESTSQKAAAEGSERTGRDHPTIGLAGGDRGEIYRKDVLR